MRDKGGDRAPRTKKKIRLGLALVLILLAALLLALYFRGLPGRDQALQVVEDFRQGVNLNEPDRIYRTLAPDLQEAMTEADFVQHFAKERSYPYLTPLYIHLETLTLAADKKSGEIVFSVAARLPGQTMEAGLVYEDGAYRVEAFQDIVDLTYLDKFKD